MNDQNDGNLLSKMVVRGKKISMFMEKLVDKELVTKDDLQILKTIIDYFRLLQERVNKSENQSLQQEYEFQFQQMKDQLEIIKEENLKVYNESEVDKQLANLSQENIDFQNEKKLKQDQALKVEDESDQQESSNQQEAESSDDLEIVEKKDLQQDIIVTENDGHGQESENTKSDDESEKESEKESHSEDDSNSNQLEHDETSHSSHDELDESHDDSTHHIPIVATNQENVIQSENSMRAEENTLMKELDEKKVKLSKAIQELNSDKNGKNAEEDLIEIQKLDVDVQNTEKKLRALYEQTDGFHSQAADQMTEELNHSPMIDLAAVKSYVEENDDSSEESSEDSEESSSEIGFETKGELLDLIKKHHEKHKKDHKKVKGKVEDLDNFKVEVLELLGQLANQNKKEEESSEDEQTDSSSEELSNDNDDIVEEVVIKEATPQNELSEAQSKMDGSDDEEYTLQQVLDEDAAHPSNYKVTVSNTEMAHIESQVQGKEKSSSEEVEESEQSEQSSQSSSEEVDESEEVKGESVQQSQSSTNEAETSEQSSSSEEVEEEQTTVIKKLDSSPEPLKIKEKEVTNVISSNDHQEIRDAHNEIIQQHEQNLETKTENVNQLSNYFAQFKKNISATKDKMLTSLKTGFEELEMELKDLIDHSTKDLNEQLVTERKKIQSTKQMLKKVLMKELDGESANLVEDAAINRFEQIQPKTDEKKPTDSFKNIVMNQEESKDDEKKINFIFNDSFIKLTNGILTNDKVKVMDGIYRVNQLLKIVLNINKQDENKIFQEVVKFEKGLSNECGGQILIMIFKLFREMFAITDENYKSSKYDHMKQVITDKTEEILHEVENAIKVKKVQCQQKNDNTDTEQKENEQYESEQQESEETEQQETILNEIKPKEESKSQQNDKLKKQQKDQKDSLRNQVDSEINQRLQQLAQNDEEEDELMKELSSP